MSDLPKDVIHIPPLCVHHQSMILGWMGLPETGPWRAGLLCGQILMFQYAMQDQSIEKRLDGTPQTASLVLNELGCLACHFPAGIEKARAICIRGLNHAAKVSQGKIYNPDWFDLRPQPPTP